MGQPDTVVERDAAPSAGTAAMRLEAVVLPVSDVDRPQSFYTTLG